MGLAFLQQSFRPKQKTMLSSRCMGWLGGHTESLGLAKPGAIEFRRRDASPEMESSSKMSVLIFNCGLLRARDLFGRIMFENPPFADLRFPHLARMLMDSGADLIALQEIYEDAEVASLVEQVKSVYPYHARGDNRSTLERTYKFHNGLMYISKYPFVESRLIKHAQAAPLESMFGDKCMLMVTLADTPLGNLAVVNMHTTAGGWNHPEKVDSIRESELREAVEVCEEAMRDGYKSLILGDLNMGPEASRCNYDFMLNSGYQDEVIAVKDGAAEEVFTWDPMNPLNAIGPHNTCPAQRCDHIFVHRQANIVGSSLRRMFTEAFVNSPIGPCTLSDHFGLLLSLSPSLQQ
mmetsp:Transcript_173857/g.557233  ORF Transcript_173857/g.557233 Transcript_173857/m.557233 type:complete len:349 (-) Transcript_173857:633-1679(-)